MPVNWNASGDFAEVVDALQTITLKDRGCSVETTLSAWRFLEETTEVAGSDGGVLVVETTWQVPALEAPFVPSVGGRVISSEGKCAVLTRVDRLRAETRWRCVARRVQGRADIAEWMDLEAAVWGDDVSGSDPVGWRVETPGVRAYAFRVETAIAPDAPSATVDTYRLVLTEPIDATPNHRFRRHAGGAFRVTSQALENRLGAGWCYDAVLES